MKTVRPTVEVGPRGGAARAGVVAALVLASACRSPGGDARHHHDGDAGARGDGSAHRRAGCEEVITPAGAQQIFERVTALRASDGCQVNGVSTELSVMRITWTRNGAALPDAVLVTPTSCAPRGATSTGRYVFRQSEGFAAQCPATFAALTTTFAQRVPPPTRLEQSSRRPRSRAWIYGVVVAVALGAFAAMRWRRARRGATAT